MKKFITTIFAAFFLVAAFGQNDVLKKHSGESIECKVIKVGENTITFKYPGEDAEQTIGKLAVATITYGSSGRKEEISEKVIVTGKEDWEKVQLIFDRDQVLGLKKGEEIRGKTSGLLSYHTAGSADKKATKKLREAAAEQGAPFVLMVGDKTDNFGVKQSIKNGVAYSYK